MPLPSRPFLFPAGPAFPSCKGGLPLGLTKPRRDQREEDEEQDQRLPPPPVAAVGFLVTLNPQRWRWRLPCSPRCLPPFTASPRQGPCSVGAGGLLGSREPGRQGWVSPSRCGHGRLHAHRSWRYPRLCEERQAMTPLQGSAGGTHQGDPPASLAPRAGHRHPPRAGHCHHDVPTAP